MTSKWNYRVICHNPETEHQYYTITEVYYSEDSLSYSERLMAIPFGMSFDELKKDVSRIGDALGKPILFLKNEKLVEDPT